MEADRWKVPSPLQRLAEREAQRTPTSEELIEAEGATRRLTTDGR